MIPLTLPSIGDAEIEAVVRTLRSGWLAHGPEVKAFEEAFAARVGVEHAVALNSCASALELAVEGLDLKGEIVVPSFTFVATANAVLRAGCAPVFADIDPTTGNLDPASVERCIGDKTVALMPVHFAGQCCDMTALAAIAEARGLALIEDSAEAIGAAWDGRQAGSFGVGCFSFFPTKNITTAEGGMLTTKDAALAERVRTLRGHGVARGPKGPSDPPWRRMATVAGVNMRMSDLQAALGRVQLERLDWLNGRRKTHAASYDRRLAGPAATPLRIAERADAVWQMYGVRIDPRAVDRARLIAALAECGVAASVHFDPPLHLQPLYASLRRDPAGLEGTERLAAEIVTLPMFPDLSEDQLEQVARAFERALALARRG